MTAVVKKFNATKIPRLLTSLRHPRVASAVGELPRGAVLGERVRDGRRGHGLDECGFPVCWHLLPGALQGVGRRGERVGPLALLYFVPQS